jgi:alpha-glucosidase (family GH31 glycosyl hydrolase)
VRGQSVWFSTQQVGFSGDVDPLAWNSFAFQPYFSLTGSNVGYGFWSHDITGPGDDMELYTRWIQFAAFSAIFRSHERGMSGGDCANAGKTACSVVKPWNVPTKNFEANRQAMVTRSRWLPLIYNATREAFETGVSLLRPMYYEFPEESLAYAADAAGNFAQYFFCSEDVFVAPVVQSSSVVSPSALYGGMAPKEVWVPPGQWMELPSGAIITGGSDIVLKKLYDVTEIPVFVKLGAMLPSMPLQLGKTIGSASRSYSEIEFTIYGIGDARSGSVSVYEDVRGPPFGPLRSAVPTLYITDLSLCRMGTQRRIPPPTRSHAQSHRTP